jgi:hypothetical protein
MLQVFYSQLSLVYFTVVNQSYIIHLYTKIPTPIGVIDVVNEKQHLKKRNELLPGYKFTSKMVK